jgi:RNA polymerase sigma-70 factor, ECF subfamily
VVHHDHNLSDEELFRRIKDDDTDAFNELYFRYSRRLLHYLLRMLNGDEYRAQDLLQDVFIQVVDHKNRFADAGKFSTWLFTIAHNRCKNEYRSRNTRKEVELTGINCLSAVTDGETESAIKSIDYEKLKNGLLVFLQSVPAPQRSIFLLRYQENLTVPEIARIMDCPAGTVKSRLHYTLRLIAARLKEYDPNKLEV